VKHRIDDCLVSKGARELVIPHRQNPAGVFNSDLFHRTDYIHFREGYANRRINVTMLYGRRGQACPPAGDAGLESVGIAPG
jgi:hypothetical protein